MGSHCLLTVPIPLTSQEQGCVKGEVAASPSPRRYLQHSGSPPAPEQCTAELHRSWEGTGQAAPSERLENL